MVFSRFFLLNALACILGLITYFMPDFLCEIFTKNICSDPEFWESAQPKWLLYLAIFFGVVSILTLILMIIAPKEET